MVDTIYAEDEIIGTKKAQEIISKFRHAKVTSIKRFGEVFNPSNQNFRIQKTNPALILAKKQKGFVLDAPRDLVSEIKTIIISLTCTTAYTIALIVFYKACIIQQII